VGEFAYVGVDKGGKKIQGIVEATSEGELRMILRAQGVRPTRISKTGLLKGGGNVSIRTISNQDLIVFTRQFGVLLSSGVPAVQALDILAEQQTNRSLRAVMQGLKDKVSSGNYLWESMASYPKIFGKLYVSLIRAGESSGSLEQILERLSSYLEESDRLKKTVQGAMMYPAIVVTIGIGVISVMMIFVIPKFEALLKSSNQELPGPTQFVLNVSHFMVNNALYLVVGTVATVFLGMRFIQTEEGRSILDRLLFRSPLFGNLIQKSGIARFSRTMQTLLSSGVNLIDAIDICKTTLGSVVLEKAVGSVRAEVENGRTLASVILGLGVFPNMAIQMINVGESTGNLDAMLGKVADFYEEEVRTLGREILVAHRSLVREWRSLPGRRRRGIH